MESLKEFKKKIETRLMPNGKEFAKCSRIELYDIITEAMQFIVKQNNDRIALEKTTLKYKLKKLFNAK